MANYIEVDNIEELGIDTSKGLMSSEILNNIYPRCFNKNNIPHGLSVDEIPHKDYMDLTITYSLRSKEYDEDGEPIYKYYLIDNHFEGKRVKKPKLKYDKISSRNVNRDDFVKLNSINTHFMNQGFLHLFAPTVTPPSEFKIAPVSKNETCHTFLSSNFYSKIMFMDNIPEAFKMQMCDNNEHGDFLVISNRSKSFAAGGVFQEGVLKKIYNYFNDDFYLVPTSVHEFLAVSQQLAYKKDITLTELELDLKDFVEVLNDKILTEEEDILSYNIYLYSKDDCGLIAIN